MKIKYVDKRFSASSLQMVAITNLIIKEYQEQGFDLTLRQVYYQFVSRDVIPNKQSEYKRLGSIINDARLAGLIDWNAIVDRTRELRGNSHWESPHDLVEACAKQFQVDKWIGQAYRVEIWIEKDALVGVIDRICREFDVPFFSCRGYTSQSEMWEAGQRFLRYMDKGQHPVVIHLGDHDPSGKDMSRDIDDRLELFTSESGIKPTIERIALNMNQIEKYNPPPNPAKLTDSRARAYVDQFGDDSWELDALDPKVIAALIRKAVGQYRDVKKFEARRKLEEGHRASLLKAAKTLEK